MFALIPITASVNVAPRTNKRSSPTNNRAVLLLEANNTGELTVRA